MLLWRGYGFENVVFCDTQTLVNTGGAAHMHVASLSAPLLLSAYLGLCGWVPVSITAPAISTDCILTCYRPSDVNSVAPRTSVRSAACGTVSRRICLHAWKAACTMLDSAAAYGTDMSHAYQKPARAAWQQ